MGYVFLITADYGNAEHMRDPETGASHTAHACNPVPFVPAERKADGCAPVQDEQKKARDGGDEKGELGAVNLLANPHFCFS
ncbi:hypothetical protein B0H19DRAFT_1199483 [Mycena capillaripes]|nr:hypothetical protein B0H19DRAFT_1199483 [Mycena capillaripes]